MRISTLFRSELPVVSDDAAIVWLVEDDPVFRGMVADLIGRRYPSVRIRQFGAADEVFPQIQHSRPDLVFLDIQLPGNSGLELTRWIKSIDSAISIAILSGCDVPEYRQAAYQKGADAYILKGSERCTADILQRLALVERSRGFHAV